MTNLKNLTNLYFVGITGVGMTALAQVFKTMGKNVSGWDVANDFVTAEMLKKHQIKVDVSLIKDAKLPANIDAVIYTGAHQGNNNPLVLEAKKRDLPTLTHAEALGLVFNQKLGVAVCGVGGKSTTSAMLAFVTWQLQKPQSFQVGVGKISDLDYTGYWSDSGRFFITEADEYAEDPNQVKSGDKLVPRFSYLKPFITIATNLKFDHPDVYKDFNQTQAIFYQFFTQIRPDGYLIYNQNDRFLTQLADKLQTKRDDITLIPYSVDDRIKLDLPGKHFRQNATATLIAAELMGYETQKVIKVLKQFHSTGRRMELKIKTANFIGFDDYAHHPHEIKATLSALRQAYPAYQLIVAFQPHTFSRTEALVNEFAQSLTKANEVILLPIFASAREKQGKISSQDLVDKIKKLDLSKPTKLVNTNELTGIINELKKQADQKTLLVTLGAGDIYKAWN